MEEILASIRRIISEDEPAAGAEDAAAPEAVAHEVETVASAPEPVLAAAPEPELEDVLELTQPLPDAAPALETHGDLEVRAPEPVVAHEPEPEPVHAPEPAPAFEAPPEPPARAYVAPAPEPVDDSLVSGHTADAASSAFTQLTQSVAMPKDGRVLEDVVRELLRPLLKTWLDENLPAIVQATVAEEVERIARRRV